MKRLSLLFSVLVIGCADGFVPKGPDLSIGRDFSMSPPDLASDGGAGDDLAVDDLAMPVDLAVPPDLIVPADLTPLMCDLGGGSDGGPAAGRLFLAAVGAGKTLHTARFEASGGWSGYTNASGAMLGDVALSLAGAPDRPLVLARYNDDTLTGARFEPCLDTFAPLTTLHTGSSTSRRPAVTGGLTADVIFKGSVAGDQRLYHSRFDGATFSQSVGQNNFLTLLAPSVVRENGTVHALFTGTDTKLYDGTVSDSAGGGSAAEIVGCTSAKGPASVVGADGAIYVVFTGMDTNLYWVRRPSGGAYSAPLKVCPTGTCLADTDDAPVMARDSAGVPVVAFIGKNKKIYSSSYGSGWSTPIEATQGGELTDHPPAIATGLPGTLAELVYVRNSDGLARHTRLSGASWGSPSTLAGASLQAPAALVTIP